MQTAVPRSHRRQERTIDPLPQEWLPRPPWFATALSLPRPGLIPRWIISPRLVRQAQLAIAFGLATAVALLYLLHPGVHAELDRAMGILAAGDGIAVGEYLRGYGVWAPLASIGLMVAQAVAAPVPAVLIAFANGLAFGAVGGGLLTIAGQTLAAIVCFAIARALGRTPVEAMAGRFGLAALDKWFARSGGLGIFLLRLVPGVSFDIVSYAAGITAINVRTFLFATIAGVAPQAFLYSYLIQAAPQAAWTVYLISWLVIGVVLSASAVRWLQKNSNPGRASRFEPVRGVDGSGIPEQPADAKAVQEELRNARRDAVCSPTPLSASGPTPPRLARPVQPDRDYASPARPNLAR